MPLDNYVVMEGGKPRLLSAAEMAAAELAQMESGKYYTPPIPTYDPTPLPPSAGSVIEYRPAPAFEPPPLGPQPLPGR